jgi:hypothetical protein
MVALAWRDVGGWAGMLGRGGAAVAATSLDDHVERECKCGRECKHEWEAGGDESLAPLIKNNKINLIIFGAQ